MLLGAHATGPASSGEPWSLQPDVSWTRRRAVLRDVADWHLEIIPRLLRGARLRMGSGMHRNPVSPEEAAEVLRAQDLSRICESRRQCLQPALMPFATVRCLNERE